MVLTENGAPSHLPMRDTKRGSTLPNNYSAKDFHLKGPCLDHLQNQVVHQRSDEQNALTEKPV